MVNHLHLSVPRLLFSNRTCSGFAFCMWRGPPAPGGASSSCPWVEMQPVHPGFPRFLLDCTTPSNAMRCVFRCVFCTFFWFRDPIVAPLCSLWEVSLAAPCVPLGFLNDCCHVQHFSGAALLAQWCGWFVTQPLVVSVSAEEPYLAQKFQLYQRKTRPLERFNVMGMEAQNSLCGFLPSFFIWFC